MTRPIFVDRWHCEHPTADLNFIAKNKLAEETRKAGFKVVLTGEGADEHFAGYSIFEADFLREADRTFLHPEADRQVSEADRLSLFEKREGDALEQVLRERGGIFAAFSTQPISLRDAVVPRRMLNGTSTCRWLVATSELPTDSFLPWTKQIVPTFDRTGTYARAISGIVRDKMVSKWHPLHTAMVSWLGPQARTSFALEVVVLTVMPTLNSV